MLVVSEIERFLNRNEGMFSVRKIDDKYHVGFAMFECSFSASSRYLCDALALIQTQVQEYNNNKAHAEAMKEWEIECITQPMFSKP